MHLPLLPSILLVSWHEISFPSKRKRQYELCRLPPCLLYVIILYHLRRSCKWLYGIKAVPSCVIVTVHRQWRIPRYFLLCKKPLLIIKKGSTHQLPAGLEPATYALRMLKRTFYYTSNFYCSFKEILYFQRFSAFFIIVNNRS